MLTIRRSDFPSSLDSWKESNELYYSGDLSLLSSPCISVVGTRMVTELGTRRTRLIVSKLVQLGYSIVSGLAAGVDTEAHKAALEFGGKTIAVMGTPLDHTCPPKTHALRKSIEAKGLVMSQFPAGIKAAKGNFPTRNRLMAALSQAPIV